MRKIGFAERWIQMIMSCVSTVSFSILINGKPFGVINPTHGIRLDDPLSPYLFILCAEGLSSMLQSVVREGQLTGIPITKGGTRINHLFFADDSLLFSKANVFEWARIQELLELYEKASGHKLNREKTFIFFHRNTKREAKEYIISLMG